MTIIESPAFIDERARWRTGVGLDCPSAANPRRIRYEGRAQLSWQTPPGAAGRARPDATGVGLGDLPNGSAAFDGAAGRAGRGVS